MICTFSVENVSGACPSHFIDTGAAALPQRQKKKTTRKKKKKKLLFFTL